MIDKLDSMFEKQIEFQKKISGIVLPNAKLVFPLKVSEQVVAIVAELGEILNEYELWKSWKTHIKSFDEKKLVLEVVDLWHFVINLALYLGISSEALYVAFCAKNRINKQRQENEY